MTFASTAFLCPCTRWTQVPLGRRGGDSSPTLLPRLPQVPGEPPPPAPHLDRHMAKMDMSRTGLGSLGPSPGAGQDPINVWSGDLGYSRAKHDPDDTRRKSRLEPRKSWPCRRKEAVSGNEVILPQSKRSKRLRGPEPHRKGVKDKTHHESKDRFCLHQQPGGSGL